MIVSGGRHNRLMDYWTPIDTSAELRGRPLRYLLATLLVDAQRPLTISELIVQCEDEGVVFHARASKVVSDALRWELRAGRVKRLRRGVYAAERVPSSTLRWIRHRVDQTRAWLDWANEQPLPSVTVIGGTWEWSQPAWVGAWPRWPSQEVKS